MKKLLSSVLAFSLALSSLTGMVSAQAVQIPTNAVNSLSVDIQPTFLNTQSYVSAIDTNGRFMYAIVDNGSGKAICQQYTLDGSPTGKSFDVTTLNNGSHKFRTQAQYRIGFNLCAENGIVVAGLEMGNQTHGREAAVCVMDFNNTPVGFIQDYTPNADTESFAFDYSKGHLFAYYWDSNSSWGMCVGTVANGAYTQILKDTDCVSNTTDLRKHFAAVIDVEWKNGVPTVYVAPAAGGSADIESNFSFIWKLSVDLVTPDVTVAGSYDLRDNWSSGKWESAQCFTVGDYLYAVSANVGNGAASKATGKILVLNKNTMAFVKKIESTDIGDGTQTIVGAAPATGRLAIFTSSSEKRLIDAVATMTGKIYFVDTQNFESCELIRTYDIPTGDSNNNTSNMRLHNIAWTDDYIYANGVKKGSRYGMMYFELPIVATSTESVTVGGKYMAGVDEVEFDLSAIPTDDYIYEITATDGTLVAIGTSSDDILKYKPERNMAGKTLSVKAYYTDNGVNYYSKGTAAKTLYSYDVVVSGMTAHTPTVTVLGRNNNIGDADAKVVTAYYNNGTLLDIQLQDYTASTGTIMGDTVTLTSTADSVRAYLISDLTNPKVYAVSETMGTLPANSDLERFNDSLNLNAGENNGTVTIKGISPVEAQGEVAIVVVRPIETAPGSGAFTYSDIEFIGVYNTATDGTFTVSYSSRTPIVDGEEYKVYAEVDGKYSLMRSYYCFDHVTIAEALAAIDTTAEEDLYDLLYGNSGHDGRIYNINFTDYDALGSGSAYQTAVMSEVKNGAPYVDVPTLQSAFDTAVNTQKAIKAHDDALDAVRIEINGESETDIPDTLVANAAVLGYNQTMYSKLVSKTAYVTKWLKGKNFADVPSMLTAINDGLCVEYVNAMQYETVVTENQIQSFKTDLGLLQADYDYYVSVGADAQKAIIKNFVKTEITAKSSIPGQFATAVSTYKESLTQTKPKPPSGGGDVSVFSPISGGAVTPISPTEIIPDEVLNLEKTNSFGDVDYNAWYFEAVCELANRGIVEGITDTSFEPERDVTREEFVKMIVEAFNLLGADVNDCDFTDVSSNRWYYVYVAAAYDVGIINGYANGEFGIGDSLTREDMAVIIAKTLKLMNKNPEIIHSDIFADMDNVSSYAKDSVKWLHEIGVLMGMEDGCVYPKSQMTRAMAAQIIFRLINL